MRISNGVRTAAVATTVGAALALLPAAAASATAPAPNAPAAAVSCSVPDVLIGWYCGYHAANQWAERGSQGNHVREIQAMINQTTPYRSITGNTLAVDGDFGPATESAVRWFQGRYGGAAAVDGIVGPNTWKMLRHVR